MDDNDFKGKFNFQLRLLNFLKYIRRLFKIKTLDFEDLFFLLDRGILNISSIRKKHLNS